MSRKKLRVEEGICLIPTTQNSTVKGEIATRTSDEKLHVYLDGADRSVLTENQVQTITNKTIDVDNNTLSNVETDNLKSGVLNTSTTLASASDTQLPSALAVKTYVDSGDVANAGAIGTVASDLSDHITATTDAHDASAISTTPISGVTGTDVQANLASLKSLIDAGGNGDVMGPASSTDNAVARFDSTTGKIIQNSSVTISDVGVVAGMTIDTATNGITNLDNANFKVNAMIDAVKIADGSVTNAEFQRLDGVTSPIQTQIDSKVNTTGGSVITPARLDAKQDTLANLTTYALTATNGQFAFSTDTKETFVVKDGQLTSFASSGSGGINYITNYTADTNINGWVTYADAAGTSPVDGTGGTPTVTLTRSTSLPLRGNASFLYTKPASNVQGQGFSYNFTIDAADQGKVLQGSFDYQIASGTFADDAMSVWIYDVTNARMIQPAPYLLKNSGLIERFPLEFQTAINSTSYRLIIHQASTSAVANTIKLDNFFVGPESKLYGSAVTDWVDYTPVWTASTTNPTVGNAIFGGKWRRVGDSMEIRTYLQFGSTSNKGSGAYRLSLPSGYSVDLSKLPNSSILNSVGHGHYFSQLSPGNAQVQDAYLLNPTTFSATTDQNSTSVEFASTQTNVFTSVNDNWAMSIKVPILGWSSSQVMSSDASTRVVAAYAIANTNTPVTSSTTTITINTKVVDEVGGFSGNFYTVKVPGIYKIRGSLAINNTAGSGINGYTRIVVAGNTYDVGNTFLATGQTATVAGEIILPLVAGNVIQLHGYVGAGTGTVLAGAFTSLNIERISGPSQIMSSETVAALYTGAPPTGTLTASYNTATFGTRVKDSHNSYSSGSYTVPISGVYSISSQILVDGTASSATNEVIIAIFIDGLIYRSNPSVSKVTGTIRYAAQINVHSIPLLVGQAVTIRVFAEGSANSFVGSVQNFFSIVKTGNY